MVVALLRAMDSPLPAPSPSRFVRTLPWMAGLLIGASAHIMWFTQHAETPTETVHVVTVPAPGSALTVHVHPEPTADTVSTGLERPTEPLRATTPASCRPAKLATAHPRAMRRDARRDQVRGAIVCTADGCTLRRSFLRQLLTDSGTFARNFRIVPKTIDGETVGVKLYGIRSGSMPALLGFENGDLLTGLDGVALPTLGQTFASFRRLAHASAFTITGERHGVPFDKRFTIRDD